MAAKSFAQRLLAWHKRHGRKDLPWQREPSPYRVWVSEIMLQQTQVATVIPYFERFMAAFPSLEALAAADSEAVLAHWSGLGYYARARNLQHAAQQVVAEHGGELPTELEALMALPGIGRSTAGAILALACGQRQPILDGNVKRVLCRHQAIAGWPGETRVAKRLWQLAETLTPKHNVAAYTQAIMDLGATVCRRARPACSDCPVHTDCAARLADAVQDYPAPRPRKALPQRATTLAIITNARGEVLLEKRPPAGIWGGLWSLPECPEGAQADAWAGEALGLKVEQTQAPAPFQHTFTHFRLEIRPLRLHVVGHRGGIMETAGRLWYKTESFNQLGLPAPIRRLLRQSLDNHEEHTS